MNKKRSVLGFKDRTRVLNWCTAKKEELKEMSKVQAVDAVLKGTKLEISQTGITEIAEMLDFKFVVKRSQSATRADNHARDAFLAKIIRKMIQEFEADFFTTEEMQGLNSMIARTFGRDTD